MGMLNSASMLLASDLWESIINLFAKWIVNYGWAIVVLTIALKLVLSPLDFLQRRSSQKQQQMTVLMQPEIARINQKYANDKARINLETQKVYKKYQTNMGGSCLIMLITMILSMVIFFTLFGSIRSYGNEKLYESYAELDNKYVATYAIAKNEYSHLDGVDTGAEGFATAQAKYANEKALAQVEEEYKNLSKKHSWLWVKNVWKSDTNTSQFVDVDDYLGYYDIDAESAQGKEIKARYEIITAKILNGKSDQNGYYILILLCVAVSALSQLISTKVLAPKGQKMTGMNKAMLIMMPLLMLVFAFTSNAVFSLYIITNSIMTTLLTIIISLIMRKTGKQDPNVLLKKKNIEVVEYSRNYRKDN